MAPESGAQADLKACLNSAADAACAEDLEGFLDCFAGSTKTKLRKETAIRFIRHDVSMEVLDTQVLRLAGNSCQDGSIPGRQPARLDRWRRSRTGLHEFDEVGLLLGRELERPDLRA